MLIDRTYAARNGRAKMTSREYLYRPAFEMGRHLIGYEMQKVLAGVDWLAARAARNRRSASSAGARAACWRSTRRRWIGASVLPT